jgi:hypothetical protein
MISEIKAVTYIDDLTNSARWLALITTGWKDGLYVQPPTIQPPSSSMFQSNRVELTGKQKLQVSVLLLEKMKLFEVAIHVSRGFVPAVARIVDVLVCP